MVSVWPASGCWTLSQPTGTSSDGAIFYRHSTLKWGLFRLAFISVVSVHRWGIPYLSPQTLVGSVHFAAGPTQGILGDGSLSQFQPSQGFQYRWHFSYRNPGLVVEGMGGGLPGEQ